MTEEDRIKKNEKDEESDLEELKENYRKFKEKYYLPDFEKLDGDFYIEKISEVKTDHLMREFRRFMSERILNYLKFTETILNPANAPMFVFSFVKSIKEEDKKKLTEIYKKLSELDIKAIKLDIKSSEESDAQFVKEIYEAWQEIKNDLFGIIERTEQNKENKGSNNNRGYFG